MNRIDLPYRQVHLDFHTSPDIDGIGEDFDPDEFAATLDKANVNSVTCFARCHHGYLYFDSKRFSDRRHPHLKRNLLAEQIEACHKRGIRVPIYTTVQWDLLTANQHPEWLCLDADGKVKGTPPFEAGFYRFLCVNSPYMDFLKAHTQEILETLPVDGLFFDIVIPQDCACTHCRAGMERAGLDPSDAKARQAYGLEVLNEFKARMTGFVRLFNKECSVFYNAGHVGPRHKPVTFAYTHFELESLPSGGWGYLHFPIAVRYGRTLGLECVGMTGKFHTTWGDFHSFKNRAALEFECFNMLAMNAKCSIGDQLHPSGRICPHTYALIGSVYASVKDKEPWCSGAAPVTEIAVLTPEEFTHGSHVDMPASIMGATRMLQEGAHQFDIVDSSTDLAPYRVAILPDEIPVNAEFARKLDTFLKNGGALIASYRSGLDETGERFALDHLGIVYRGEATYSPDFVAPGDVIGAGLPHTEHVMYLRGLDVEAIEGADILAETVAPYFNRTWRHFCSHRHTPSAGKIGHPCIVRKGQCVYFSHPIFGQYQRNAPRWCKTLVLNALDMLLPEPLIRVEAPSSTLVSINSQDAQRRWVMHLLHYIPERRGTDFDVIEDIIPLHNVKVSVRTPAPVKAVMTVPQNMSLGHTTEAGCTCFVLPELAGHQMVSIAFA